MPPRNLLAGEYAVLALLRIEPMYGYQMAHYFEDGDLGEVCPIEQSLLYTYLRNVQARGLVAWTEVRAGLRPPRKLFELTPDALTLIDGWLRAPVERMREVRLELLVKLYVLGRTDPAAARELLRRQIDVCEAYQLRVTARAAALSGFSRLVAESKASAAEATAGWLRRYAAELDAANAHARPGAQ